MTFYTLNFIDFKTCINYGKNKFKKSVNSANLDKHLVLFGEFLYNNRIITPYSKTGSLNQNNVAK